MEVELKQQIQEFANRLYESQETKTPIGALSSINQNLTIDDAYAIQLKNIERRLQNGDFITGKKIGLTSLAMQKLINVDEPDYGHLLNSMDIKDGVVKIDEMLQPKVEGEIAFVLKEDICGPNATVEDVLKATDYVVAALEIVDSRVENWKIKLFDTVSDNASSGCYVLSDKQLKIDTINLLNIKMSLYKNGELVNSGIGADVLGNPAIAVCWLANKLWKYGVTLKKGEVVLSGALSAAPPAKKGDVFEAKFSHLGNVIAKFI